MKIMQLKINNVILLIFLFSLAFRAYFVFSDNFADGDSYYNIRTVEYMLENKEILKYDDLSYGGRRVFGFPLFYFVLLFFRIIFGSYGYKIFSVLIPSCLIFVSYLIAKEITKDNVAITLSVLLSSFIPSFITSTLNSVSVYPLVVLVIFYMLFCLIKIEEKKYLHKFIFLGILLSLLHPAVFFLGLSLLFYLSLMHIESLKYRLIKREVIVFFIFLSLLIEFIIFKEVFLSLGFRSIWQNIPSGLLNEHFKNVNILDMFYGVGIIPFLFGGFGVFFGIVRAKKETIFLFSGLMLACLTLLFFRLINFEIGLIFLGISLAAISGLGFEKLFRYIKVTKFARFENHLKVGLFLIALLSFLPIAYSSNMAVRNSISEEEVELLNWLKDNTDKDVMILSLVEEGNYITGIAERKDVMDDNFLGVRNIDIRYREVEEMFTTESIVTALQLLNKYNVDYIYFSDRAREKYSKKELTYVSDKKCFRLVKKIETVEIYRVAC